MTLASDETSELTDRAQRLASDAEVGPFGTWGQSWSIRTSNDELRAMLGYLYASLAAPSASVRDHVTYRVVTPREAPSGVVLRDAEVLRHRQTSAGTLGTLVWAINRQVIERSLDRIVLHAAGASRDGKVVALAAPTESGKTTLVAGLLQRGWSYLTDEALAVEQTGRVEGYAKPLSIDPGSWEVLASLRPDVPPSLAPFFAQQWQVPAHAISSVVKDGTLAALVFPTYRANAATSLDPLTPASTLRLAAESTFVPEHQSLRPDVLRDLAILCASVPAYQLISSRLSEACKAVESCLEEA